MLRVNKYSCLLVSVLLFLVYTDRANSQQNTEIDNLLSLPFEELLAIKVSSVSRKEEKLSSAPATAVVITAQQIKDRGYEYFEDLLRDIPGFDLNHVNGTYKTIFSQRGTFTGENNRSLILIDGIVESNILEGSLLHGGQYSLHNVKKVEIIYGPASALYGANAFGGIISITTKNADDIDGLELQLGTGSFDSQYYKLLFGKNIGGTRVMLSTHFHNSDGPTFKQRTPKYSNSYIDNAYSIVARVGNDNFTLGLSRYDRPAGLGTFSNISAYESDSVTGSGLLQADFNGEKPTLWHMLTQTGFIQAQYSLDEKLNFSSKIFARQSWIDLDSYEYAFNSSTNRIVRSSFGHYSQTAGGEVKFEHNFSNKKDLIWGLQFEKSDIERGYRQKVANGIGVTSQGEEFDISSQLSSGSRVRDLYTNIAGFIQYRHKTDLMRSTNFIVGARYDYNDQYGHSFAFGETFNPRVGIVIEPTEKVTYKVLVGTAFRASTSFDRFTETTVRRANPDITPEREQTVEFGVNVSSIENLIIDGNIFYNQFEDSIISNVDTGEPIPNNPDTTYKENRNAGSGSINGAELRLTTIFEHTDAFFNLTYQRASQEDQHGVIHDWPNIAEWKANTGFTYRHKKMFSVYFVVNWVGSRSTSVTSSKNKVAGYALANLSLNSDHFFIKNLKASLTVNNLFDDEWMDPGIRTADGNYYAVEHPQPGMSAMFELSYSF